MAINYRRVGLSLRERPMPDFAMAVVTGSNMLRNEDFEALPSKG